MTLNEFLIQNYADELVEAYFGYYENSEDLQEKIDAYEATLV